MSTSKFDGIPFRIEVVNSGWFPNPELGDDGIFRYSCRAFFESKTELTQIQRRVSIVTWKRPLGTVSIIGHLEAGWGEGNLQVPLSGGRRKTYRAVLTSVTNTQGYARHRNQGHMADLSFVIVSDIGG